MKFSLTVRFLSGFFIIIFFSSFLIAVGPTKNVSAAYDGGRLMDNGIFLNSSSMSAQDIQNFLINKGSGFANLSFYFDCSSTGMSASHYQAAGAPCGQTVSASVIIYYAAQIYGINPQVILSTLQKEQGSITDPTLSSWQINQAMGYACPTTGSCDGSSSFLYQIDNGVWLLRFHMERARGNMDYWFRSTSWVCGSEKNFYKPNLYPEQNVNFFDEDGTLYRTHYIANAATSSMYCYTPHAYNNPQGLYGKPAYGWTGRYYSGSYNFVYWFERWFGSTTVNFSDIIKPGHYEGTLCPFLNKTNNAYKNQCTSPQTGDFNGDGFQDVAVISVYPDKTSFNLWLFPGSSNGLSPPVFQQHFNSSQYWNIAANKLASADVNGDGKSDLILLAANAFNGITMVQILGSSTGLNTPPNTLLDRHYTPEQGWMWTNIQTEPQGGDFNGDGYGDIAVYSLYPDKNSFNLWVFQGGADGLQNPVFQQHFDVSQYWSFPNIKTVTTDINGDHVSDLLMFAANAYDGITIVQLMGSPSGLKEAPIAKAENRYNPSSGWSWANFETIRQGGDFNGDGYGDIAVYSLYPDKNSFNLWVFQGGADGLQNPVFQQHFDRAQYWNVSSIKTVSGDFNGDKKNDLAMFAANAYDGITTVQIPGSTYLLDTKPTATPSLLFQPSSGWRWSSIR